MSDETPPLGSAAYALAADTVMKSLLEVLERETPGTAARVHARARAKLEAVPVDSEGEGRLVQGALESVDAIVRRAIG